MRFKTLMTIKAIVSLILGVLILLVPDFIYSLFGAALAAGGVFAAREYGSSLIGNMILAWVARSAQKSNARLAIILALFIYDGLGALVTLIAIMIGALNVWAWFVFLIYLFFTLGFGYYLLQERKTVPEG
jgi:fatty-acid desaturase